MTREKLGQLSWLRLEMEDLENRIMKLEEILTGRTSRIDGMPWLNGKKDLTGDMVAQIADLREQYEERKIIALRELKRIEEFIAQIADSQMRLLFTLRYIDNLSWHQVAWKIGGNNTADSVRMVHNRYLKASDGE